MASDRPATKEEIVTELKILRKALESVSDALEAFEKRITFLEKTLYALAY